MRLPANLTTAQHKALEALSQKGATLQDHGAAWGDVQNNAGTVIARVHINTIRALTRKGYIAYNRKLFADLITEEGRAALRPSSAPAPAFGWQTGANAQAAFNKQIGWDEIKRQAREFANAHR